MLEEYKELCKQSADSVPGWQKLSKNDLCRAYVASKDNPELQNAYMAAILYKYWNLIGKYYYMSSNCASPEECYGWLVDSVSYCVTQASWEDPSASIHKDPNGPDKVINRCMKCARLTYYQFINRKKRKEDFGLISLEELKEAFGNNYSDIEDESQQLNISDVVIIDYIVDQFRRKNYFVSFLIYFLISENVFDLVSTKTSVMSELNLRKLCKVMNEITDSRLYYFSEECELPLEDVLKAAEYIRLVPQGSMKKKILQALENLKHSALVESLLGGRSC